MLSFGFRLNAEYGKYPEIPVLSNLSNHLLWFASSAGFVKDFRQLLIWNKKKKKKIQVSFPDSAQSTRVQHLTTENKTLAPLVPCASAWKYLVRGFCTLPSILFKVSFSSFCSCQYCQNCCLCKSIFIQYRCSTDGLGCCKDHLAPGYHFVPTSFNRIRADGCRNHILLWILFIFSLEVF